MNFILPFLPLSHKHHQTGSHIQLRHRVKLRLRVTVPRHDKFDIPPFVAGNILKQAELTKEEFNYEQRGECFTCRLFRL